MIRFLKKCVLASFVFAITMLFTAIVKDIALTRLSSKFCIKDQKTAFRLLSLTLKQHALELLDTQRGLAFSAQYYHQMGQHLKAVNQILKWIEEGQILNNNSFSAGKRMNISKDIPRRQEVCPEKYMGESTLYGWPFYRKGFQSVKCTDFVPMHELVTVLIRIPEELPKPAESCVEIARGLAKYYPNSRVILATGKAIEESTMSSISNFDITFENEVINDIYNQAALWKRLVEKVKTPYALIAPHLTHFDDDINLERLVRVLSYDPQVAIAGGSYRNLTGHWDIGCQQVSFRNWTATYKGGYYYSFNECIACDFLTGPWMAKTKLLKDLDFDLNLNYGAFHDLFWRFKKLTSGKIAVSCPDVMFNIKSRDIKDEELVEFANKHLIHKIVEPDGRVRWYGCRLGYNYTSSELCSQTKGIGLSPADMENLADAVKFLMKECEDAGVYCELIDGTLLGAVKFSHVIPWEQDADIAFLASNISALEKLERKLNRSGYNLDVQTRVKEIREGRPLYGAMSLRLPGWGIDLFGHRVLESAMLTASGREPTKLLFAGQWVNVMRNPGLYSRNHYGHEIYKHQEHLRSYGRDSFDRIWGFYDPGEFLECETRGHSACLDQFPADGNMQFTDFSAC